MGVWGLLVGILVLGVFGSAAAVTAIGSSTMGNRHGTERSPQETRVKLDGVDVGAGQVVLGQKRFEVTAETVIFLLPSHGRKRIYNLTEIPEGDAWVRYELGDDGTSLKALYIYTGETPE